MLVDRNELAITLAELQSASKELEQHLERGTLKVNSEIISEYSPTDDKDLAKTIFKYVGENDEALIALDAYHQAFANMTQLFSKDAIITGGLLGLAGATLEKTKLDHNLTVGQVFFSNLSAAIITTCLKNYLDSKKFSSLQYHELPGLIKRNHIFDNRSGITLTRSILSFLTGSATHICARYLMDRVC